MEPGAVAMGTFLLAYQASFDLPVWTGVLVVPVAIAVIIAATVRVATVPRNQRLFRRRSATRTRRFTIRRMMTSVAITGVLVGSAYGIRVDGMDYGPGGSSIWVSGNGLALFLMLSSVAILVALAIIPGSLAR